MSGYNALISVILHFESYRNIDIMYQGVYYLRATLISEDKTSKAIPMDVYSKESQSNCIFPSVIDETASNSKMFVIKYCDEETELNDFCEFQLEIPAERDFLDVNYELEVELYFGDANRIGGIEKLFNPIKKLKECIDFVPVVSQKFLVTGVGRGVSQYFQMEVPGEFYGLCNMLLHSALIDFRYRAIPASTLLHPPIKHKELSLYKYLLSSLKKDVSDKGKEKQINELYKKYTTMLIQSYNKIKERFIEIRNKCLTDKQYIEHKELLTFDDLVILDGKPNSEVIRLKKGIKEDNKKGSIIIKKFPVPLSHPISKKRLDDDSSYKTEINDVSQEPPINSVIPTLCLTKKFNKSEPPIQDLPTLIDKLTFNLALTSIQIIELWQKYLYLLRVNPKFVKEMFYLDYLKCMTTKKYLFD